MVLIFDEIVDSGQQMNLMRCYPSVFWGPHHTLHLSSQRRKLSSSMSEKRLLVLYPKHANQIDHFNECDRGKQSNRIQIAHEMTGSWNEYNLEDRIRHK